MKRKIIIFATILFVSLFLFLIGHKILVDLHPKEESPQSTENISAIYHDSLSAINSAQNMVLTISKTQETTLDNNVFLETSEQTLTYSGLGTEKIRARVSETLSVGNCTTTISEIYVNGTVYSTVNECHFSSQISPNEYISRFAPAVLLDANLYTHIDAIDDGTHYIIDFSEPKQAEKWSLCYEGASLITAKGTAYINHSGQLTKSTYSITYDYGDVRIETTYTVGILLTSTNINTPDEAVSYIPITYLDGPKILERSSSYLLEAKSITSEYSDSIYFQAFGDARMQSISLAKTSTNGLSAVVNTTTLLTNDNRVDQHVQLEKNEFFLNNTYTSITGGGEPIINPNVTADDMRDYCQNLLVGNIMLPEYITSAQIVPADGKLRIAFSASDAFAMLISANACQMLYQNSELLSNLSVPFSVEKLLCYLELDIATGIPIASGIDYAGTYTIEGVSYSLQYQTDQVYDVYS